MDDKRRVLAWYSYGNANYVIIASLGGGCMSLFSKFELTEHFSDLSVL